MKVRDSIRAMPSTDFRPFQTSATELPLWTLMRWELWQRQLSASSFFQRWTWTWWGSSTASSIFKSRSEKELAQCDVGFSQVCRWSKINTQQSTTEHSPALSCWQGIRRKRNGSRVLFSSSLSRKTLKRHQFCRDNKGTTRINMQDPPVTRAFGWIALKNKAQSTKPNTQGALHNAANLCALWIHSTWLNWEKKEPTEYFGGIHFTQHRWQIIFTGKKEHIGAEKASWMQWTRIAWTWDTITDASCNSVIVESASPKEHLFPKCKHQFWAQCMKKVAWSNTANMQHATEVHARVKKKTTKEHHRRWTDTQKDCWKRLQYTELKTNNTRQERRFTKNIKRCVMGSIFSRLFKNSYVSIQTGFQ